VSHTTILLDLPFRIGYSPPQRDPLTELNLPLVRVWSASSHIDSPPLKSLTRPGGCHARPPAPAPAPFTLLVNHLRSAPSFVITSMRWANSPPLMIFGFSLLLNIVADLFSSLVSPFQKPNRRKASRKL